MSRTVDFLSMLLPGVRRFRAKTEKLRVERDEARRQLDEARARPPEPAPQPTSQPIPEIQTILDWLGAGHRLGYVRDGLATVHTPGFLGDPAFEKAYATGVAADHDYSWQWRVHVGLWAARLALDVEGDFVECGVNRGFLTRSIMADLEWANVPRVFHLLDTFDGLVESQITEEERQTGRRAGKEGNYSDCFEVVQQTFAPFSNVRFVRGMIPDSLAGVEVERVAYLSIDMNCAAPEMAAAEFFWPRLSPGAVVLLDDYAYAGYEPQRLAWNAFAAERGISILNLPTGQGLIINPRS